MPQARDFVDLIRRITTCSKHLLPQTDPLGNYDQAKTYRILAFRLFAHAELEGFIEDCAQVLVDKLSSANDANTLPGKLKTHLLLHRDMVDHYPPLKLNYLPHTNDQKYIRSLLNGHASVINQNNGISEKDVIKLFSPLGFPLGWFDAFWLNSMGDLARARGEVAHRSVASTTLQPTPLDERRRLVAPLLGIRKLADETDRIVATL